MKQSKFNVKFSHPHKRAVNSMCYGETVARYDDAGIELVCGDCGAILFTGSEPREVEKPSPFIKEIVTSDGTFRRAVCKMEEGYLAAQFFFAGSAMPVVIAYDAPKQWYSPCRATFAPLESAMFCMAVRLACNWLDDQLTIEKRMSFDA
jgi:hypothetical protein